MFSRILAATAIVSLAVAPAVAEVVNAPAAAAAAVENEEGESGIRELLLPVAGAVSLTALIFVAFDGDDDDDDDDDYDDDDDPVSS